MAVKTTYALSEALELTKEQIKALPKEQSSLPERATAEQRQLEKSNHSIARFMDFYSDVVFTILNIIEKDSDLITDDAYFGNEYGAIKITSKDFQKYIFSEYKEYKHEFVRKLNEIANSAPAVWIVEKTEEGKQTAISTYPILIKRKLETNDRYNGLNNFEGVIAEMEVDFNKELFIGKNTNGLTKSFRLLPDTLPTTVKDFVKNSPNQCMNSHGEILSLQEKHLFRFIIFLRNHYNRHDFLQNPVNMAIVFNPKLINDKGALRNTEDFYLYLLMFVYSYNKLYLENKLDGFNFALGVPYWEIKTTKLKTKSKKETFIRIPTFSLEEITTTKTETTKTTIKNFIKEKTTITQELKGMTKEEIIKNVEETNKELLFTMEYITNRGISYTDDTYQEMTKTLYEFIAEKENIQPNQIYKYLSTKTEDYIDDLINEYYLSETIEYGAIKKRKPFKEYKMKNSIVNNDFEELGSETTTKLYKEYIKYVEGKIIEKYPPQKQKIIPGKIIWEDTPEWQFNYSKDGKLTIFMRGEDITNQIDFITFSEWVSQNDSQK